MHILVMTAAGVAGLLAFTLIAHAVNRQRNTGFVDGGRLFVWIWLLVSVANFFVGVMKAGISPLIELGVFTIVFGLPATLALVVSSGLRRRRLRMEN